MRSAETVAGGGSGAVPEVRPLEQTFRRAVGKRALLLLSSFPFLIIGTVRNAVDGLVCVEAETTHLSELEGKLVWVRLDAVEVFYIEDGPHAIPRLHPGPASA